MKQFKKIALVIWALLLVSVFVSCSDGDSGDSGKNEDTGNTAVCTWVQEDDNSNYYVFYADKTVECYIDGKLEYPRSTLGYSGDPTSTGSVTLKTNTGVTLFTFSVTKNGTSVTATEKTLGTKYTMGTSGNSSSGGDSSSNATTGNTNGENTTNETQNPTDFICYWVHAEDKSNYYYIFYNDNTAEYYVNNELTFARSILTYTGDPTLAGTVKIINGSVKIPILIAAGMNILTFTVTNTNDGITATETSSKIKYTMGTNWSTVGSDQRTNWSAVGSDQNSGQAGEGGDPEEGSDW